MRAGGGGPGGLGSRQVDSGPGLVGGQAPRSARTLCGPLVPGMPCVSDVLQTLLCPVRTHASSKYLPSLVWEGKTTNWPGTIGCGKRYQSSAPGYLPRAGLGGMPALLLWVAPTRSAFPASSPSPQRVRRTPSLPSPATWVVRNRAASSITVVTGLACERSAGRPLHEALRTLSDLSGSLLLHFLGAWVSVFPFCFHKEPHFGVVPKSTWTVRIEYVKY